MSVANLDAPLFLCSGLYSLATCTVSKMFLKRKFVYERFVIVPFGLTQQQILLPDGVAIVNAKSAKGVDEDNPIKFMGIMGDEVKFFRFFILPHP